MMKRLFTTLFIALVSIVTTWATDYDLWICGTRVTSDNATTSLSSINGVGCGIVYYDASANALYLNNTYLVTTATSVYPIKAGSGVSGLKIIVGGMCSIETKARIGLWLDNCSNVEILGDGTYGDGSLTIKSTSYDILLGNSNSNKVSIKDGVSLFLLGGGINYSGTTNKTLLVNNAELLVRRTSSSSSPVMVHNLTLTNAYLSSPAWTTYTWNGSDLTKGNLTWAEDIHIKPGVAPADGYDSYDAGYADGYDAGYADGHDAGIAYNGGDMNGDGNVNLADVTKLVNMILDKDDPHEYVDLGLPSGTLWATCNVGANSPEEYGQCFMWGETTGHKFVSGVVDGFSFDVFTAPYCNGALSAWTKYCTDSSIGYNGFTDGKTELELMDDAAYVNWGKNWRMPTKEQAQELLDYTKFYRTTLNDVEVIVIQSLINNKILYFPLTGRRNDDGWYLYYEAAYIWTRTLDDNSRRAWNIMWRQNYNHEYYETLDNENFRFYGFAIRPVRAQ